MVRYIDGTLSSTYLRSINWQWLTCTILESLYRFHLAEGCKWSSSLTTMWMGTFFIDLPMFASNHHMVHWEGWRLGNKSWYLVWRKSKVFQFKFDIISRNNNVDKKKIINLPMFASNHHFGALGRKKTRRQVMILCLKEVKSIPIQVWFGSLQFDTLSLAKEGIFWLLWRLVCLMNYRSAWRVI
jgi:hypothetical protein